MKLELLHFWLGPLPREEIFPEKKRPFLRHWFLHPIKRRLAKYYLWVLQHLFNLKVIAITGSVGKTTTKDMLLAVLSADGPTVATTANITPVYNIPTTILRCLPWTKYLILEMGIEYKGDMDFYNWLTHPDIAIITSINITHTLYLGDLETVAHEKGKIAQFAKYLIIPDPCPNVEINTQGQIIKVPATKHSLPETLIGSQFYLNASLAISVAKLLRVPAEHYLRLSDFTPPKHRMELIKLRSNSYLIDDTYNANPLAVKESLKALFETAGKLNKKPIFVFGQMNELGQYEKSAHREIGELIKDYKLDTEDLELFCIGPATHYTIEVAGFGHYYKTQEDLFEILKPLALNPSYLILIKGSRSWQLDQIVLRLRAV